MYSEILNFNSLNVWALKIAEVFFMIVSFT